jgi:transcriptional regulator with PAS, ATPase and Fis domain
VDIRVVSATKKDLATECRKGRFREDLMFRINVITLTLPPLRNRPDDIPLLIRSFINKFSESRDGQIIELEPQAAKTLQQFHWPGNIRQLKNVIERAIILMGEDCVISLANLPEEIREASSKALYKEIKAKVNKKIGVLRQVEELAVREILLEENGNVSQAAKRLGISRSMLYRSFKCILDEFDTMQDG